MSDQAKINEVLSRLDELSRRQEDVSREIRHLQTQVQLLKGEEQGPTKVKQEHLKEAVTSPPVSVPRPHNRGSASGRATLDSGMEKFIGENLANKIGIIVTVIGVAIGAKYAIDHELISPWMRILFGYLMGAGLFGFALRLKKNYVDFSAVLLSGSMAILYFVTYSAYALYDLMPHATAFALMVVYTAFTVLAALNYNRQIIAHLGMVGAYAIPFLLYDGSGRAAVLFTYMAIINAGILAIAFKKYWKALYYSSFSLTWLTFFSWFISQYRAEDHFALALVFLVLFFFTFYFVFLAYKLLRTEKFGLSDITMLLANSFIFYGLGYTVLNGYPGGERFLGFFTLCNAILHFAVSRVIRAGKRSDLNLQDLVSGLVLVYFTTAVAVELDGGWVTVLWIAEAALLFWLGRTRGAALYEKLAYSLMVLSFFSMFHDWSRSYSTYEPLLPDTRVTPLMNATFLASLIFICAMSLIYWLYVKKDHKPAFEPKSDLDKITSLLLPGILIFSVYYTFRTEISGYWFQLYLESGLGTDNGKLQYHGYGRDQHILHNASVWLLNYTLLFGALLAAVNLYKIRNKILAYANLVQLALTLVFFLTQGLFVLSELREQYLQAANTGTYLGGDLAMYLRYISYLFVFLALYSAWAYQRSGLAVPGLRPGFDAGLHATVLWIASSEVINLMNLSGSTQSYKLVLSLLWGSYSLFLVTLGIWKKRSYLRFGAIALFGITLIKLFLYDLSDLNTLARTVVFVSLGILLLVISFLYNKYKGVMWEEANN